MDWDKINRWLTLVANAGVLGGLILVAVQIQQSTKITRAQVANDYFLADMQLELAMMGGSPVTSWIKAIYTPDELTREDAAVVDRYFNYGLVQLQRLQRMNDLGMADDKWTDRISYMTWHLGNEVGRRWWDDMRGTGTFPDDLVAAVDEILAAADHRDNQNLLDALLSDGGS